MLNQEENTRNEFTYEISEEESVTLAVVNAVSAVSATSPVPRYVSDDDTAALDPLYNAIDPEALDSLFSSGNTPTGARLEFEYHGYEITVHSSGRLSLSEA